MRKLMAIEGHASLRIFCPTQAPVRALSRTVALYPQASTTGEGGGRGGGSARRLREAEQTQRAGWMLGHEGSRRRGANARRLVVAGPRAEPPPGSALRWVRARDAVTPPLIGVMTFSHPTLFERYDAFKNRNLKKGGGVSDQGLTTVWNAKHNTSFKDTQTHEGPKKWRPKRRGPSPRLGGVSPWPAWFWYVPYLLSLVSRMFSGAKQQSNAPQPPSPQRRSSSRLP